MNVALQTDPGNTEALQALASVRLSQQRPDDAKQYLEQAWVQWKDLEPGKYSLDIVLHTTEARIPFHRRCATATNTDKGIVSEAVPGA